MIELNEKKAAVYIRVSTDDQTEYSPDSQMKLCIAYAKDNNIDILPEHIYRENGISGRTADKRPQFQKMIANAKKKPKPFNTILVYDFSRFARNREESVTYKTLLRKKLEIEIISITQPIDEKKKESVILESIYEAMDEYYSLNLSENVKRGKKEKATRGEFQGVAPYGYKYDKNTQQLYIDEEKAEIVKMIFKKWIEPDTTIRKLCKFMNDTNFKTTRGHKWCDRSMKLILQNITYTGKVRFTEGGMKRNYDHPDMIISQGKHPPIIDDELWNLAQKKMQEHKDKWYKYKKEYSKNEHWLRGIIKCSECGASLSHVNAMKGRSGHFQCCGYNKGRCLSSHYIRDSVIIPIILEQLKKDYSERLNINIGENTESIELSEISVLKKQLDRLKIKRKRIKDAYINGIDTINEYKENKTELDKEESNLKKELEKLNYNQSVKMRKERTYKICEEAYKILSDDSVPPNIKDTLAHKLFEKIVYNKQEETIEITYK